MMMMLLMVDVLWMGWPMDELDELMVWVELVHFELSLPSRHHHSSLLPHGLHSQTLSPSYER